MSHADSSRPYSANAGVASSGVRSTPTTDRCERNESEPVRAPQSGWTLAGEIVLVAGVYLLAAKVGLMMDAVSGFAALVWPASGLATAALILRGRRLWPAVTLGAFLANYWVGAPVLVALGIAIGNTLEAVLAAWAISHVRGFAPSLTRVSDVLKLILVALGSTVVSALTGVSFLIAGGRIPFTALWETGRAWWIGDIIGDLVFAPLLLVWSTKAPAFAGTGRVTERALLVLSLVAVGVLAYEGQGHASTYTQGLYLTFPILIGASLRFGPRGAVTTTFVCSALAISLTAMGYGAVHHASLHERLLGLQVFMGVSAATFLVLAASVAERRQAVLELRVSHDGLEAMVEQGNAELVKAHERLQLLAELEEAVGARDTLISVASHELRSPLAVLELHVELMMRNPKAVSDPRDLASKLQAINRQVARLTKLVDRLLDASRIKAGRLDFEVEDVDLAAVIREIAARYKDEVRQAGSTLTICGEGPVIGRWDRLRMEQVVTNLLSNAIKYGAGCPIDIAVEADTRVARLTVRDLGPGIAEQDKARIFARFERLPQTRQQAGFGLGLWIVSQIVEGHKGTIHVVSELGRGSKFIVEIPRFALAASSPNRSAPSMSLTGTDQRRID